MSLEEAVPPRRKRGRPFGSKSALRTFPEFERWLDESGLNSQRIMSFKRWCLLNDFSVATGRRILASGNGPETIQVTDKKIGVSVAADAAWKASRVRRP